MPRVPKRILRAEPLLRLILTKNIRNRIRIHRRIDAAYMDLAQFVRVFENVRELFLKEACLVLGKF